MKSKARKITKKCRKETVATAACTAAKAAAIPGSLQAREGHMDLNRTMPAGLLHETEFGPLYFFDGDKLKLNISAIADSYAKSTGSAFSSRDDHHYVFGAEQGIWLKQERSTALVAVSRFIQSLACDTIKPLLLAKRTPALCSDVLKVVEGLAPMGEQASAELVAVDNGVLDLTGDKPSLRAYRKEDWFTAKLPWSYDSKAKCDRFVAELLEPALRNTDDVELLQRDFGRQLVPGNKAQTISLFIGEGGSGKSTLLTILETILGEHRIAHLRTDKLTTRFETHAFLGKSTLVGKDVSPSFLSNTGAAAVKSLTGSDFLESERKFGGKHKMRGEYYVVVTANARLQLRIQGDEEAWRRRLVCYQFSQKVSQRVADFAKTLLEEEGAGILTWLVAGYVKHRSELATHGKLNLTQAQQERVNQLVDESQSVRSYLKTHVKSGKGNLTVDELHSGFRSYAKIKGWKNMTKQAFCGELYDQMGELFQSERSNHIKRNGAEVRGYPDVMFQTIEAKPVSK